MGQGRRAAARLGSNTAACSTAEVMTDPCSAVGSRAQLFSIEKRVVDPLRTGAHIRAKQPQNDVVGMETLAMVVAEAFQLELRHGDVGNSGEGGDEQVQVGAKSAQTRSRRQAFQEFIEVRLRDSDAGRSFE